MTRSPLYLAALASAAVPGLDPVSVERVETDAGHPYDVAFVQDTQHRRWVIRVPHTAAASAQLEQVAPLLGLLARRAPFAVPVPKGWATTRDGLRASVHAYIPGVHLDLGQLPPGPGISAELGRTIALVHNTERALYEEAGLPTYDADDYRSRRLAALDRAAASGRVPAALLARWEHALEDVSLWRFAPTPVHGSLGQGQVIVHFPDDEVGTGTVRGLTGWEAAKVADPADDFADLVADASPRTVDTVLEAYAHTRVDRPDPHLLTRARLVGELRLLAAMLAALAGDDDLLARSLETRLAHLDESVSADDGSSPALTAVQPPVRRPPPTDVAEETATSQDVEITREAEGTTKAEATGATEVRRETEAAEASAASRTSVETAPVETAPVETASVETASVETAPVEAAPVEAAPVEAVPVETATDDADVGDSGHASEPSDEPGTPDATEAADTTEGTNTAVADATVAMDMADADEPEADAPEVDIADADGAPSPGEDGAATDPAGDAGARGRREDAEEDAEEDDLILRNPELS